jgi:hypothetical protein
VAIISSDTLIAVHGYLCPKLKMLPEGIEHLTNLKKLHLEAGANARRIHRKAAG